MRLLSVILVLFLATPVHADIKQSIYNKTIDVVEKLGDSTHTALAKAQKLGFVVNEVRFEISITPKIEVFFRDTGDTGLFSQLVNNSTKSEEAILRLLQSTRKFNIAHYSPTGIKLITGIAKPSVEILTSFTE